MTANIVIMQLAILAVVLESDLGRRKIGWLRVGRPVVGVAVIVPFFFTSLPTGGNDLLLQGAGALAGAALGLFSVCPLLVSVDYQTDWRRGWPRTSPTPGGPAALGAGVLGRSGTPVASWLMNEADLLLVVGASFSNHTGIAPYKPIIQIDDSPEAIGRFTPVDVGLLGDPAVTLTVPLDQLDQLGTAVKAVDQRDDTARPLGHLAGREGTPGRRRPRARAVLGCRVRRPDPALPH
ncbi:hypothetical protein [Streptomyces sp. NBC_00199]|uniref:hypothetical protein n=1 Tax=Streptomyces sp. NBC_00199 TaxID=2975678 RepID=UPI002253410F|nr:hypothetical protein [Streptomyces sp. NBC_00199]MCX5264984.1 hypothetical protein [Streptomyces sp. NBC_00199]